jgi:hypothetical protein
MTAPPPPASFSEELAGMHETVGRVLDEESTAGPEDIGDLMLLLRGQNMELIAELLTRAMGAPSAADQSLIREARAMRDLETPAELIPAARHLRQMAGINRDLLTALERVQC